MVVNVLATHRFHLLDLARELSSQGYDVKFYSYVPKRRCAQYGLSRRCCVCFLWLVFPFLVLERLFRQNHKGLYFVLKYRNRLIDWYVSHTMRRCDVLISLGCVYTNSILKAKIDWGAKTVLEWGSKHILEQLKSLNKIDIYPKKQLKIDLKEYQIVNYISIPATHVRASFIKHGIPESKLLVNPYGVNLNEFHPTECSMEFDLIAVGGWRYEKGSDLLIQVCREFGYKLLHVGGLVNMEFPDVANMVHYDPVNQSELIKYYERAKVFVLPSRSEGLSLVQAQAIACGLPIVCSSETGCVDLRNQISDRKWIIEFTSFDIKSLHRAIEQALSLANTQVGIRSYVGEDIYNLSWRAYGRRYSDNLAKICNR